MKTGECLTNSLQDRRALFSNIKTQWETIFECGVQLGLKQLAFTLCVCLLQEEKEKDKVWDKQEEQRAETEHKI